MLPDVTNWSPISSNTFFGGGGGGGGGGGEVRWDLEVTY